MVQFIVVSTDERQRELASHLPGEVYLWEESTDFCQIYKRLMASAILVLPTPAAMCLSYTRQALTKEILKSSLLFGGVLRDKVFSDLRKAGVICYDFMEMEEVVYENANITAEATLCELISHSPYLVEGQKIMIAGYGRCGRAIARILGQIGAKPVVLARRKAARERAREDGFFATDFSYGPEEAYSTTALINTVPDIVISDPILRRLPKDAVVMDIASLPGGIDEKAASKYGIMIHRALGLPAKYETASSGGVLAKAVMQRYVDGVME